jgi:hypothetical protein
MPQVPGLDFEKRHQIIKELLINQKCIKSPFEKGGFRGIFKGYFQIPPNPPLVKGGIKSAPE